MLILTCHIMFHFLIYPSYLSIYIFFHRVPRSSLSSLAVALRCPIVPPLVRFTVHLHHHLHPRAVLPSLSLKPHRNTVAAVIELTLPLSSRRRQSSTCLGLYTLVTTFASSPSPRCNTSCVPLWPLAPASPWDSCAAISLMTRRRLTPPMPHRLSVLHGCHLAATS